MRLVRAAALAALVAPVLAPAATQAGNPPAAQCALAVEFPYYLCPRAHWERELVWLKNLGVRTVEFAAPWNWHEVGAGDYDFTGRTSPRRDRRACSGYCIVWACKRGSGRSARSRTGRAAERR